MHQARALRDLLCQDRKFALRTGLLERFVPDREITLGPAVAAIEKATISRLLLRDLTFFANRTGYPESNGLSEFAVRIIAAGEKLPVFAALDDHGLAAFLAKFVREFFRDDDDLALVVFLEILGVLAFWIIRTGEKRS